MDYANSLFSGPNLILIFILICFAALFVIFYRTMRSLDELLRAIGDERKSVGDQVAAIKLQIEDLIRFEREAGHALRALAEQQVGAQESWTPRPVPSPSSRPGPRPGPAAAAVAAVAAAAGAAAANEDAFDFGPSAIQASPPEPELTSASIPSAMDMDETMVIDDEGPIDFISAKSVDELKVEPAAGPAADFDDEVIFLTEEDNEDFSARPSSPAKPPTPAFAEENLAETMLFPSDAKKPGAKPSPRAEEASVGPKSDEDELMDTIFLMEEATAPPQPAPAPAKAKQPVKLLEEEDLADTMVLMPEDLLDATGPITRRPTPARDEEELFIEEDVDFLDESPATRKLGAGLDDLHFDAQAAEDEITFALDEEPAPRPAPRKAVTPPVVAPIGRTSEEGAAQRVPPTPAYPTDEEEEEDIVFLSDEPEDLEPTSRRPTPTTPAEEEDISLVAAEELPQPALRPEAVEEEDIYFVGEEEAAAPSRPAPKYADQVVLMEEVAPIPAAPPVSPPQAEEDAISIIDEDSLDDDLVMTPPRAAAQPSPVQAARPVVSTLDEEELTLDDLDISIDLGDSEEVDESYGDNREDDGGLTAEIVIHDDDEELTLSDADDMSGRLRFDDGKGGSRDLSLSDKEMTQTLDLGEVVKRQPPLAPPRPMPKRPPQEQGNIVDFILDD